MIDNNECIKKVLLFLFKPFKRLSFLVFWRLKETLRLIRQIEFIDKIRRFLSISKMADHNLKIPGLKALGVKCYYFYCVQQNF